VFSDARFQSIDIARNRQLPCLRFVHGSIGLRDIRGITAWETTQPTPEARSEYLEEFRAECEELGATFQALGVFRAGAIP
jgi:hypothetical protein